MSAEGLANNFATTLQAGVTTVGQTSWSVNDAIPSSLTGTQFRCIIGTELIIVTSVTGSGPYTWTVTRGAESTTAATYVSTTAINQIITIGGLRNLSDTGFFLPNSGNWVFAYAVSAGTSLSNATITKINYATSINDPSSLVSASVLTIPTGAGGTWNISATMGLQTTTASAMTTEIFIYKNGAEYSRNEITTSANAQNVFLPIALDVGVAAGDTIDIRANQTSGGTITSSASAVQKFTGHFVSSH